MTPILYNWTNTAPLASCRFRRNKHSAVDFIHREVAGRMIVLVSVKINDGVVVTAAESEYDERTDHTKIDPTHRLGSIDGRFGGRVARNI